MQRLLLIFSVILFLTGFQSWAQESIEETLNVALQGFAQDRVDAIKLSCGSTRAPASASKTYFVNYEIGSNQHSLKIETDSNKVSAVALMGDSIEFSRWKTFVPVQGKFRVDAAGNGDNVSELLFNSRKPNYIKALEQLAPKVLECCSKSSCSNRLTDY